MLIYLIAAFLLSWLIVLSYVVYKTRKHYFNLISRTKKSKIDEILDQLIRKDEEFNVNIDKIKNEIEAIIGESKKYYKKIGLVRFNPFDKAGGEQSFVVALLDSSKNGLVINFIYTHEGIRVYTKRIKEGRGEEYNLSEEEQEAIEKSR